MFYDFQTKSSREPKRKKPVVIPILRSNERSSTVSVASGLATGLSTANDRFSLVLKK